MAQRADILDNMRRTMESQESLLEQYPAEVEGFIRDIRPIEQIAVPGPGIALRAAFDLTAYHDALYGVLGIEFPSLLQRAVPKRKAEFLAGRYLTSLALQGLVGGRPVIGIGEHRQPLWPSPVCGSLSHTTDAVGCVLSTASGVCLGIDIENVLTTKTANNIADSIIDPTERAVFAQCDTSFELCLTAVFSAKESLFKALYPTVGAYFDFKAARLTVLDFAHRKLVLELTQDLGLRHRRGDRFQLGLLVDGGKVLSYLVASLLR